jgi:hypothetical protein
MSSMNAEATRYVYFTGNVVTPHIESYVPTNCKNCGAALKGDCEYCGTKYSKDVNQAGNRLSFVYDPMRIRTVDLNKDVIPVRGNESISLAIKLSAALSAGLIYL